jgi:hypothetical protein
MFSEILGSHSAAAEHSKLPGCYTVQTCTRLPLFKKIAVKYKAVHEGTRESREEREREKGTKNGITENTRTLYCLP